MVDKFSAYLTKPKNRTL